jgi:hypothetical protein
MTLTSHMQLLSTFGGHPLNPHPENTSCHVDAPIDTKLFIHDAMVWYIFYKKDHIGHILLNFMHCLENNVLIQCWNGLTNCSWSKLSYLNSWHIFHILNAVCASCVIQTQSWNCTTTKFIIMCSMYTVKTDELKDDKKLFH